MHLHDDSYKKEKLSIYIYMYIYIDSSTNNNIIHLRMCELVILNHTAHYFMEQH